MRNTMNMWRAAGAVFFSVCAGSAIAAEGPYPIHVSLIGEARHDSNANRSAIPEDELAELQLTSAVSINGSLDEYEKLLASIAYQWSQTDYRENSQPKDATLTGNANLRLGGRSDFYLLSFNHSSTQVLVDPTVTDISSNREDRDTFGGSLTLKTKPDKQDQFSVTFSQTAVKYDEFEINDSDGFSAELNYTRQISPLNSAGARLSYTDVSFPSFVTSDYDTTLLYLYFQRKLRSLRYFIAAGLNQTSSLSGDDDSPYAQFNIGYFSGVSQFSLNLSSEVTDSSRGAESSFNGAASGIGVVTTPLVNGGAVALADGSLVVRDQIQRDSVSLSYRNLSVLSRCSINVQLDYQEDDYFTEIEENSNDLSATIRLSYRATRSVDINFSLRHSAFEFTDRVDANNFEQNSAQISLDWQSVSGLSISAFIESLERNFELRDSYSKDLFGLNLRYLLM